MELARAVTDYLTKNKRVDTNTDTSTSAKHNSYGGKSGGIIWRLLGKGENSILKTYYKLSWVECFEKLGIDPLNKLSWVECFEKLGIDPLS